MTATTNPAPSFDAIAPGTVVVFRKLGNRSRGAFRPDRVEPLQGAGDAIFMTGHRVKLSNGVVSWKRTHVILSPGFDELIEVREPAPAADTATTKEATMTDPKADYAAAVADCRAAGIRESVLRYSAEHIERGHASIGAETRYLRQVVLADVEGYGGEPTDPADRLRHQLDQLDEAAKATPSAIEGINAERERITGELMRLGTVRYPAGTPEHDAALATLAEELPKFVNREAPYDREPEPTPGAARLVGLEASDLPAVVEHLTTDREAVAAAFAPVVDQLADAADPESRARAELAKLQAKNSMRRSADLIAIDLLPHLAETFAFVRGEQPTAEGRAAIDQLADALTGWVPGFVELVGFEWRKLEEIADGDDSTCSVCGVELPGIGAHDVGKHEEHRQAGRHEARMTKLRAERPELFADKPAATSGHDPDFADRLQNGAYDRD